jgi:hypothetical protein
MCGQPLSSSSLCVPLRSASDRLLKPMGPMGFKDKACDLELRSSQQAHCLATQCSLQPGGPAH